MAKFKPQGSRILDAAIVALTAEFRQSVQILLDKELRRTKRGAALLAASASSGAMIGISFTPFASQIGMAISGGSVSVTHGDLVFGIGVALQVGIQFLKRGKKAPSG
ncbi:MAG: hypothetical protein KGH54_01490 [Candidatus Micrarchaeota archaeon]|nr:hypothetical protein [Candidatus Micrarchaeota archaeon]